jgi:hypothetical protein
VPTIKHVQGYTAVFTVKQLPDCAIVCIVKGTVYTAASTVKYLTFYVL